MRTRWISLLALATVLGGCGGLGRESLIGRWSQTTSADGKDPTRAVVSESVTMELAKDGTITVFDRSVLDTDHLTAPGCTLERVYHGTFAAPPRGNTLELRFHSGKLTLSACPDASMNGTFEMDQADIDAMNLANARGDRAEPDRTFNVQGDTLFLTAGKTTRGWVRVLVP
ncbi:MAG: hypothetical protein U0271_26650 [Polyangiaceae bacterium]